MPEIVPREGLVRREARAHQDDDGGEQEEILEVVERPFLAKKNNLSTKLYTGSELATLDTKEEGWRLLFDTALFGAIGYACMFLSPPLSIFLATLPLIALAIGRAQKANKLGRSTRDGLLAATGKLASIGFALGYATVLGLSILSAGLPGLAVMGASAGLTGVAWLLGQDSITGPTPVSKGLVQNPTRVIVNSH
jgi:hypothetical protein